jgi:hypothetical protein
MLYYIILWANDLTFIPGSQLNITWNFPIDYSRCRWRLRRTKYLQEQNVITKAIVGVPIDRTPNVGKQQFVYQIINEHRRIPRGPIALECCNIRIYTAYVYSNIMVLFSSVHVITTCCILIYYIRAGVGFLYFLHISALSSGLMTTRTPVDAYTHFGGNGPGETATPISVK